MLRTASKGLIATLAIVALGAVAPATAAQAADVSFKVSLSSANGSGCPDGNASARAQSDGSIAIDFDTYYAWSGGNAPVGGDRRNCQFALNVQGPSNWTYAVEGADYAGYAVLEKGIAGQQSTLFYFQAVADQDVNTAYRLDGPYDGTWQNSDSLDPDSLVYAPCGGSLPLLNVNADVRVTQQTGRVPEPSAVWLDPSIAVHLTWRQC
jgi:Domain of unknown function (DUF4360)